MKFLLVNLAVYILASDFTVLRSDAGYFPLPESQKKCFWYKAPATSLKSSDCKGLKLKDVPQYVDSGIQALFLADNKLRHLTKGSFSRYTSLEYLYINDNRITDITEDAINELPYLKLLQLSENSLRNLPPGLFQLPYLEDLRLTTNELRDDTFELEVKSPLVLLEVGENHLTKIPGIGLQPTLTTLNLTRNKINQISVEDVAPYCALKVLDLTHNPVSFDGSTCDCFHLLTWARDHRLNVKPPVFCNNATFESCEGVPFSNQTLELSAKCFELIKIQAAAVQAKKTWTIAGSCIGAILFCILVWLYCFFKKNKKRNRKLKEEQRLAANNANTELLNSNLPDQLSAKALRE